MSSITTGQLQTATDILASQVRASVGAKHNVEAARAASTAVLCAMDFLGAALDAAKAGNLDKLAACLRLAALDATEASKAARGHLTGVVAEIAAGR